MTIPLPLADAPRKRHMCASQEQLAEAQRMANVGSWEVDFATGEHAYSEQFCSIFGIDPDEPDAVPDVKRLEAMEKRARETLEPAAGQFRFPLPVRSTRTSVPR